MSRSRHVVRLASSLTRSHTSCTRLSRNPWVDVIRAVSTTATINPIKKRGKPEAPPKPQKKRTLNITKVDAVPKISQHHKLSFDDKKVLVPWEEGKTSYYQHIWLRDHCPCPDCLNQDTRQRQLDTFSISRDIKPTDIKGEEEGLRVEWDHDKHESFYTWDWLHRHSYAPRLEKYPSPQFKYWGNEIKEEPPVVQYKEVMASDEGVAKWTSQIEKYGFCFVDGVPITPQDTEKLVTRIGHVQHTHYGGFWDFTADLSKKDMAYTTLALPAHTDTSYFSVPAGLQMFHMLEFHSGEGGESLLVDGFRAARILRDEKPDSYTTLSQVRIPAHASGNEDVSIEPYAPFPVLNHHPVNGELIQVRWNNEDRATMDRWTDLEDVEKFYDAIRDWNDILKRETSEYWEPLKPGRALIFDNWRVLHGRAAFSGYRRMCGAYVTRDDYQSRLRMTNWGREEILKGL